jgi:hypothetical protein
MRIRALAYRFGENFFKDGVVGRLVKAPSRPAPTVQDMIGEGSSEAVSAAGEERAGRPPSETCLNG